MQSGMQVDVFARVMYTYHLTHHLLLLPLSFFRCSLGQ